MLSFSDLDDKMSEWITIKFDLVDMFKNKNSLAFINVIQECRLIKVNKRFCEFIYVWPIFILHLTGFNSLCNMKMKNKWKNFFRRTKNAFTKNKKTKDVVINNFKRRVTYFSNNKFVIKNTKTWMDYSLIYSIICTSFLDWGKNLCIQIFYKSTWI